MLTWMPARLWPRLSLAEGARAAVALAAVGTAVWLAAPATAVRLALALLVETAAAIAWLDVRRRLIADLYSLAVAALALLGGLGPGWAAALEGAFVGAGLLAAVRAAAGARLKREALGWGDVKLAGALGLLLGPVMLLWVIAAAAGAGAIVGLWLRRREREPLIPLGALLAPAAAGVACWLRWR